MLLPSLLRRCPCTQQRKQVPARPLALRRRVRCGLRAALRGGPALASHCPGPAARAAASWRANLASAALDGVDVLLVEGLRVAVRQGRCRGAAVEGSLRDAGDAGGLAGVWILVHGAGRPELRGPGEVVAVGGASFLNVALRSRTAGSAALPETRGDVGALAVAEEAAFKLLVDTPSLRPSLARPMSRTSQVGPRNRHACEPLRTEKRAGKISKTTVHGSLA
mmetsp:Transcript_3618/g.13260  ORF Transcript_3618/g.13260 Transcript_3618/m.13260 type:complete len:222 (+) Transcript_3618:429-1094(+)